jgi:hypothetical protein
MDAGRSTWADLKFDMPLQDVRTSLGSRITSEVVPEKNPAVTVLMVKPIVIDGATGQPRVIIDNKSGRLMKVAIDFSINLAAVVSKQTTKRKQ